MTWFAQLEHVIVAVVVIVVLNAFSKYGLKGGLFTLFMGLPGVEWVARKLIQREMSSMVKKISNKTKSKDDQGEREKRVKSRCFLPEKGVPHDELRKEMERLKAYDFDVKDGKAFAYVYTTDDEKFKLQKLAHELFSDKTGLSDNHDKIIGEFHRSFMHENALNPILFPTLRQFENEVVSMSAAMLNGDADVVGSLTSGGTESCLMAMFTFRNRAKKLLPHITHPEIVAPITIHPAFEKAACYFQLTIVHTPLGPDFRADVQAMEKAVTGNTIGFAASAPQYCHGVVDPIEDIAALALRHGLPFHVDACFGGFMLPWVEKLGYDVPKFDFRVNGVSSVSADIHKYGFGAKGASVVLYRDSELRKYQMFVYTGWPGGMMASPTMAGTRPGGNIAGSWAALKANGQEGYLNNARVLMEVTEKLKKGINNIQGLCILGNPHMTSFAIGAQNKEVSIHGLADHMEAKGWKVERQQKPPSLHCTILPHHVGTADNFLKDLELSVAEAKVQGFIEDGMSGAYGMLASIPSEAVVDDCMLEFYSQLYRV